ncbi:MAG TPA: DMT family transporter [Ktedonobacteraceae bacterium]
MQEIEITEERPLALSRTSRGRRYPIKYDLLALLMTVIWGGTFLVTKETLKFVGPFTYLSLCYLVAMLTLIGIFHRRLLRITRSELLCGLLIGVVLFAGYACQTVGMQWTSVSKTGFITGLYVPLVPLLSLLFLRQRVAITAWAGVLLSLAGLFLLSLNRQFNLSIGIGEWLLLACAVAFAMQIVLISKFAPDMDAINLALVQLACTTVLSLIAVPLHREPIAAPPLLAWVPICLLGIIDMAFTLVGMNWVQQYISGTRAALIYSLEPLWAVFFGVLLAGDVLSMAAWIGCSCIFAGMIIGRLEGLSFKHRKIQIARTDR